jgi:hypothetical protein
LLTGNTLVVQAPRYDSTDQSSDLQLDVVTVADVAHPHAADLEKLLKIIVQGLRQIVWASQNPSKPCSEMLRGLEVVKTNDIAQALNQTIQVQPLGPLLDIQPCPSHFHRSSSLARPQIRKLFAAG